MLVALLTLAELLSIAPVSPASAATAPYATATICFTQRGGGAFNGQVAAEYWLSDRGWYRLTYVNLPTSGCETIGVVPG